MKKNSLSYDSALKELQQILERIQGEETGLEELQSLTSRAMELLAYCRIRLRSLKGELNHLLEESTDDEGSPL